MQDCGNKFACLEMCVSVAQSVLKFAYPTVWLSVLCRWGGGGCDKAILGAQGDGETLNYGTFGGGSH